MTFRFLPLVTVMVTIFLLSHTPGEDLPPLLPGADKVCHAAAWAALAAACFFALSPRITRANNNRVAVGVLLFCLLYALSDEFHQSFITGRYVSLADLIADCAGALAVILLRQWWWNRRRGGAMAGDDRSV